MIIDFDKKEDPIISIGQNPMEDLFLEIK